MSGSKPHMGTTESNFVRISPRSSAQENPTHNENSKNNVVAKERNPYAVTLHNVDKFDMLT